MSGLLFENNKHTIAKVRENANRHHKSQKRYIPAGVRHNFVPSPPAVQRHLFPSPREPHNTTV